MPKKNVFKQKIKGVATCPFCSVEKFSHISQAVADRMIEDHVKYICEEVPEDVPPLLPEV